MALIKYDRETTPTVQRGKPTINFGTAGVITLNLLSAELLNVSGGGKISIFQDDEDGALWYIAKDEDGFELRDKGAGKNFVFNSAYISKAFREAMAVEGSCTVTLGAEPDIDCEGLQCYALITANLK